MCAHLALLAFVLSSAPPLRIAYVVNTWWPKVDGAAISAMGHVRYFASQGHPVLVVRPAYPSNSPLHQLGGADPQPPTPLITFVDFSAAGARGGGYEPESDPWAFPAVERQLCAWQPDVLLVMDPDMFMFDVFRVPGFNSLLQQPSPPVTIACFTFFAIEAVLKMPEYWWMHNAPMRALFTQGMTMVYGMFDHIFLNGARSMEYLQPLHATHGTERRSLAARARVVRSRGVPADFCTDVSEAQCDALGAVRTMREHTKERMAFLYVGRLSYDKSVDELLRAFEIAARQRTARTAILYLVGTGELLWLVKEYELRLPGQVKHLGIMSHSLVSCVLREASAYISAAHNETYGRSLVEALRCSLPVVTMSSSNMHVQHEANGLLAEHTNDLASQLVRTLDDAVLFDRLAAEARNYPVVDDPNAQMLGEITRAHKEMEGLAQRPSQPQPWHPFWSVYIRISLLLDFPQTAAAFAAVTSLLLLCMAIACCRRCRGRAGGATSTLEREHAD